MIGSIDCDYTCNTCVFIYIIYYNYNNYYKQMRPFLINIYIDSLIWLMSNLARIGASIEYGFLFCVCFYLKSLSFSLYINVFFFSFLKIVYSNLKLKSLKF